MKAMSTAASAARHVVGVGAQAFLVAAIVATLAFGIALGTGHPLGASSVFAAKGGNGGASTTSGQPTLTLTVPNTLAAGTSVDVAGTNFIPSSGGQQVVLWVGYPNDYCSPDYTVCHGFYAYPVVQDDGTFNVLYSLPTASGTGTVSASQWNAQKGKWETVASGTYTAP